MFRVSPVRQTLTSSQLSEHRSTAPRNPTAEMHSATRALLRRSATSPGRATVAGLTLFSRQEGASYTCSMPTEIIERTERCAYCLLDTIVVTVEQLISRRGDVVASTVIAKARCTNADCIGSRMAPR